LRLIAFVDIALNPSSSGFSSIAHATFKRRMLFIGCNPCLFDVLNFLTLFVFAVQQRVQDGQSGFSL